MAYPAHAYSRSDSRSNSQSSLFTSASTSARPSSGQGQQNDQQPRLRSGSGSRQNSGAASSFSSATGSFDADQNYAEQVAEQLRAAHEDSHAISDAITCLISSSSALETDQLVTLFSLIKKAQKNNTFTLLRRESPSTLTTLGTRIASLLIRLSSEIDSGKFDISPLNAEDIHHVCNALAAVVGDGPGQSIFLKQDLKRLHIPLQSITDAMLRHATDKKFIEKCWDNTQLLNVLNWISRGLKQGVLSEKNDNVRRCFASSLELMQGWIPVGGETTGPATHAARLDSRQLSKCMVQINT